MSESNLVVMGSIGWEVSTKPVAIQITEPLENIPTLLETLSNKNQQEQASKVRLAARPLSGVP